MIKHKVAQMFNTLKNIKEACEENTIDKETCDMECPFFSVCDIGIIEGDPKKWEFYED